jgi:hypothetical protein
MCASSGAWMVTTGTRVPRFKMKAERHVSREDDETCEHTKRVSLCGLLNVLKFYAFWFHRRQVAGQSDRGSARSFFTHPTRTIRPSQASRRVSRLLSVGLLSSHALIS